MGKFKDFMGSTGAGLLNEASKNLAKNNMETVSYTHLTLPTNSLV